MQVEVLSSVVSSVVHSVGNPTVVDVGAGQVSSIPFSGLSINLNCMVTFVAFLFCIAKFSFWVLKELFD